MPLHGKSHQGQLPITVQENPVPVTGYFVNGSESSYRPRPVSLPPLNQKERAMTGKSKSKPKTTGKGKPSKPKSKKPYKKNDGSPKKPPPKAEERFLMKFPAPAQEKLQSESKAISTNLKSLFRLAKDASKEDKAKIAQATDGVVAAIASFADKSARFAKQSGGMSKAERLQQYEKELTKAGKAISPSIPNAGQPTNLQDRDGLVLHVGDRVRPEGSDRSRSNYGTVIGVTAQNRITVRWDKENKIGHHTAGKLIRTSPYKANEGESVAATIFKQGGAGAASFFGTGLVQAVLRLVADAALPAETLQKNEVMVDAATGIVSMIPATLIGANQRAERYRTAIFSGLALRVVALVGKMLPSSTPEPLRQFMGSAPTSTLDGFYERDTLGAPPTRVQIEAWRPSGVLAQPSRSQSLAPSNWEQRLLSAAS